ncbi:hypothetical protein C8J55DRAFT_561137 [Lentinula edodes]|uniref:Uncharacterized protein n=1 Tax=Lentinula lateritia TaxID=40482 RepID=A0A9W9ABA2_9AGAR|nr:hypothetical protein C8J55DRAFT_561137 [Lentinula edodes]
MSLLGTQVLLHGSNSSTGTYHKADAISTVSGLKETRAVHECVSRGVNDIARGGGCRHRAFHPSTLSIHLFKNVAMKADPGSGTSATVPICCLLTAGVRGYQQQPTLSETYLPESGLMDLPLLLNPPGSAQLTWLLDNPPGFWTIQLALSTAPEQNHPLFLIISYPIRCRSAPSINCALCTHFGKRAQNRRRMGQAYFTRLWTSAERFGNSATRTTSLEGEPSGTNSVRVPTVCGYLLFRSREGGGQNPYHISYWRLFARIDLELFVLNEKPSPGPSVSKLARPEFPERRASRYLDTSDVSTSEHLDIDDVSVSRCLDIDDVSTSRCPDIGYA